jgi:predicted nucleic acid-binding protein
MTVRLYLDTAPIIYLVEQVPRYAEAVDRRVSSNSIIQVVSDLTRLECRVQPVRDHNDSLLQDYDDYFNEVVTEIVSLSGLVMDRATDIRAYYGFKTPDAIHLAAAVVSDCDVFLTNDQRLDRFSDIAEEVVQS